MCAVDYAAAHGVPGHPVPTAASQPIREIGTGFNFKYLKMEALHILDTLHTLKIDPSAPLHYTVAASRAAGALVLADVLCSAKQTMVDCVEQLREDIASLKRTTAHPDKHFSKRFDVAGHLAAHTELLLADEDTNRYLDKAHRIIAPQLFAELVRTLERGPTGDIDVARRRRCTATTTHNTCRTAAAALMCDTAPSGS